MERRPGAGSEYCGNPEHHEYELYLAVEDVDHSRTKTKSPQINGIVERFHKTVLNEFYRVAFRKKLYAHHSFEGGAVTALTSLRRHPVLLVDLDKAECQSC